MQTPSLGAIILTMNIQRIKTSIDNLALRLNKILPILAWLLLITVSMLILHMRYPLNFDIPNFYGEDGNVYVENILDKGWLAALLTPFNGYFIVLQYGAVYLGMIINQFVGSGLDTLPKAIALASYFSIALICTLPWVLFRRRLGLMWTLLVTLFLLFVPLGASDFTVIGTIGNLKFAFFFAAFLLALYRVDKELCPEHSKRIYVVDFLLLLCLFTNILVVALLPLVLYRYRKLLRSLISASLFRAIKQNPGLISVGVLGFISLVYIVTVSLLGIPEMKGYLDGPLNLKGLINALYRSSWYGVLYPFYTTMNFIAIIGLLLLTPTILMVKKYRAVSFFGLWAIFISVAGFVMNRPGVTEFFTDYTADGGPGQFFYGATMIFIFLIFYMSADWFNGLKWRSKALTIFVIAVYVVWAFPYAGDGIKSYARYSSRPTITQTIESACTKHNNSPRVILEIYPLPGWQMDVDRRLACEE